MGLDNGIVVEGVPKEKIDSKYVIFEDELTEDFPSFHICYWRKCWNIRNLIFDCIDVDERETDGCDFTLEKHELIGIIDALAYFSKLSEEEYESYYANDIWGYYLMISKTKMDIDALMWLVDLYDECPNIKVIFYDSY